MKKLLLFLVSASLTALPAGAAMNFYRDANGQIVVEVTDTQSAARLLNVMSVPDDPPGTAKQTKTDEEETQTETSPEEAAQKAVAQGTHTIINAVLGDDPQPTRDSSSTQDTADDDQSLTSALNFEERQESFATYVRDVNWKTGLQITWRDYSFFRRLKMVFSGMSQLTKPIRFKLEMYVGDLDDEIEKSTDKGIDKLAKAARGHSFSAMSRLSLTGLVDAIDKKNPFLLMLLDEDSYNKIIENTPQMGELFEDMYTFFKIRASRMEADYDQNTD